MSHVIRFPLEQRIGDERPRPGAPATIMLLPVIPIEHKGDAEPYRPIIDQKDDQS